MEHSKSWLPGLLSLLLLVCAAAPGHAQKGCDVLLAEARDHYVAGRFKEAETAVEACLEIARRREETAQAWALLAKIRVATDELDQADAAIKKLLLANPEYVPDLFDPPRFVDRVNGVKRETTEVRISSVSKTSESLREAPATVSVLTAEDIARRGYSDLEALVHDLSGFDVSRSSGSSYSNLYQRGYRSDVTTRTQLLVDGVVENDLFSQVAYLSRQYPLSNVERVEVIYGPASTMYGANAFAGVINVVTRDPGQILADKRRFAVDARLTLGSWNTRNADVTLAGRSKNEAVGWSLTARRYESDEMDLSRYPDWDYDLSFFDTFDYAAKLNLRGASAQKFLADHPGFPRESDLYTITYENGAATAIELTPQGVAAARQLDKGVYSRTVDGFVSGYGDKTDAFLLHGKLTAPNLVLGFQVWDKTEGWTSVRTDRVGFGERYWSPQQGWFYLKYFKTLGDNSSLTLFSHFREHRLDGNETTSITVYDYQNGLAGRRGLAELAALTEPEIELLYWYVENNEFVNELTYSYSSPGGKLSVVSGLEHRLGSLQGAYIRSDERNPAETGPIPDDNIVGSNRFSVTDIGLYAQASYRPREDLKLVAGGRLDDNSIQDTGGFGTVFNPRLAAIYMPGDFVLKAIYSEAFQDATFLEKFNVTAAPNPTLAPETVKNYEISAGWRPDEKLAVEAVWYDARYDGAVALKEGADCTHVPPIYNCDENDRQFQNIGSLKISGLQLDARLSFERLAVFDNVTFFGNYTYADPFDESFNDNAGARVADIASHRANLGVSAAFLDKFDVHLRANYVGARRVGAGTDLPSNDLPGGEVEPYFVVHGSLRWRPRPHYSLQLVVNNLFDQEYYHPGIRGADGLVRPHQIPQQERAVFLRLEVTF